jgi:hypothetical protein
MRTDPLAENEGSVRANHSISDSADLFFSDPIRQDARKQRKCACDDRLPVVEQIPKAGVGRHAISLEVVLLWTL